MTVYVSDDKCGLRHAILLRSGGSAQGSGRCSSNRLGC
jgi:hypothetical protein